jgi:hypothetical protein
MGVINAGIEPWNFTTTSHSKILETKPVYNRNGTLWCKIVRHSPDSKQGFQNFVTFAVQMSRA